MLTHQPCFRIHLGHSPLYVCPPFWLELASQKFPIHPLGTLNLGYYVNGQQTAWPSVCNEAALAPPGGTSQVCPQGQRRQVWTSGSFRDRGSNARPSPVRRRCAALVILSRCRNSHKISYLKILKLKVCRSFNNNLLRGSSCSEAQTSNFSNGGPRPQRKTLLLNSRLSGDKAPLFPGHRTVLGQGWAQKVDTSWVR